MITSLSKRFNRHQWITLYNSIPMSLTENEIDQLKKINADFSIEEVDKIYLPLSRLLNFYYISNFHRQTVMNQFLGDSDKQKPYIISIAGSVAAGKSTTARVLQKLLSRWPEHRRVELITTDGFLHSNKVLQGRNLMHKKGFPQTYDINQLVKCVFDLKSGASNITVPVYSHVTYDIIPGKRKSISNMDILILEGVNVLQNTIKYSDYPDHIFISDFIDFSIYIDAPADMLKNWYVNRFLKFYERAIFDSRSYFRNYIYLTKKEVVNEATTIWNKINYINLKENILPTREYASLVLTKSENHSINQIILRM